MKKPLLLIQEGIYLPKSYAEEFSQPVFFKLSNKSDFFKYHRETEYLLIRANCPLSPDDINLLPKLKYLGLVSTGTDNLPWVYLKQKQIPVATAEGANAWAVFEYCLQAIFHWIAEHPEESHGGIGILGRGRIGRLVFDFFSKLGFPVKFYDPFLPKSHSLAEVLSSALVSLHVPLTTEGPYPTFEMISKKILSKNNIPRIINTSRGKVIEKNTLSWLSQVNRIWAQDVYYEEPPEEILPARFSTPHIAGYSVRGRLGGVEKVLRKMFPQIPPLPYPEGDIWFLEDESKIFRQNPKLFQQRRDNFPWRKEILEFTENDWSLFKERFAALPEVYFKKLYQYGKSVQKRLGTYGNYR